LLWLIAASNLAYAQDTLKTQTLQETVVIGTRFSVSPERSGKVTFRIKSDQLQTRFSVADALNDVPGIQMDGNFGTPGTNLSYFVRGGRNKQTLLMLDGVPMNDPSGIDPFYDLRFVSASQVGQVERFFSVPAVGRADELEQDFVLRDGQGLPLAEHPTVGGEVSGEHPDLAHVRLCHGCGLRISFGRGRCPGAR